MCGDRRVVTSPKVISNRKRDRHVKVQSQKRKLMTIYVGQFTRSEIATASPICGALLFKSAEFYNQVQQK
jgi:hypothetical protein